MMWGEYETHIDKMFDLQVERIETTSMENLNTNSLV